MGTLGKGRSTGSNAQYDISNLHFYRDGEDIGIAEFFGVDSSSIDKASTMVVAALTTPKKAAKGNLIGTWGFSAKAAGLTIMVELAKPRFAESNYECNIQHMKPAL